MPEQGSGHVSSCSHGIEKIDHAPVNGQQATSLHLMTRYKMIALLSSSVNVKILNMSRI